MTCQFKNLLGEPNKGLHSLRIALYDGFEGLAIFDILLAITVGVFISKIFNISLLIGISLSLLLGIILHRVFCVRTTIDKLLFPSES